jgi:ribosomal-protein-alanine N-acetyltransferase
MAEGPVLNDHGGTLSAKIGPLDILFRPMSRDDLDTICQLEKDIFKSPWSKRSFEVELSRPKYSHSYVIEHHRSIIAYTVLWFMSDECHIANLAVAAGYRNRGIGGWLLKKIVKIAKNKSSAIIHLEVRISNREAIRLYENFGFQAHGVRKEYYADGEDALLMSRPI